MIALICHPSVLNNSEQCYKLFGTFSLFIAHFSLLFPDYLFEYRQVNQGETRNMTIESLIGGNIATLLVYRTSSCSYQYQILFQDGSLF